MSLVDAVCPKCGEMMGSWLTESGDNLIVEPCVNKCTPEMPDKYSTDEELEAHPDNAGSTEFDESQVGC